MNRLGFSFVSLLSVLPVWLSTATVSAHDAGQPVSSAQQAAYSQPHKFDIASDEATVSLTEFSRQADLQVLFDYQEIHGQRTQPVTGMLKPLEALQSMLRGTGLVASQLHDGLVVIRPVK